MGSFYSRVLSFCKRVPPTSGKKSPFNVFSDLSVMLGIGGSTVLLFLLWNLIYLAVAQAVVWLLISIMTYKQLFKPYYEREEDKG
jgi:hypothetical protein